MSKSCLTGLIWFAASVSASAAPLLPGFVLAGQTAHVSFYSRGERVDTAGVEKKVTELEKLFGQTLDTRANYYRYASAQEIAAGTGYYAAGVTFAATGDVHSTQPCHDHELVHLVAGRLGTPGAFFEEGLAVAVGNHGQWQGRSADRTAKASAASVTDLVAQFDRFDPASSYAVAGSFVSYLVRTRGMAQVVAFFRSCKPGANTTVAFADTFGASLDQAAADWRKSL
jgi:hypothetical protein